MSEFRQTVGHIVIMQLLIAAMVVDKWTSKEPQK